MIGQHQPKASFMRARVTHTLMFLLLLTPGCAEAQTPTTQPIPKDWATMATDLDTIRKNPGHTEADLEKAEILQMKLARMMVESSKSNYHIKGEVVDEDGKRLEGVTMKIARVESPREGPNLTEIPGKREQETHVINGEFEASATGWWGLGVLFIKDGYYDRELSLTSDSLTDDEMKTLLARGEITPSPVIKNGWRVEMMRKDLYHDNGY